MISQGMAESICDDGTAVIVIGPSSPSNADESRIAVRQELSADELVFDVETAQRFPEACQFFVTPSVSRFGFATNRSSPSNAVIQVGINDQTFPDAPQELFDPSRVPPRFYLKIKEAVASIEKEIKYSTVTPRDGVPPLTLALKSEDYVKRLPWIRSTLAVRKKSSGIWKSRLCLRGDTFNLQTGNFTSSPTTHRSSLKMVISASRILQPMVFMLDVSVALLQSYPLRPEEKCAAIVPDCISLPPFSVLTMKPRVPTTSKFILAMNNPLYGSQMAPLRWWMRIRERFRLMKFRQHRLDVCMFSYRSPSGNSIEAIFITHVDDFLITDTSAGIEKFKETMDISQVGELLELSIATRLVYLGINFSLNTDGSIGVSQTDFIARMTELQLSDFGRDPQLSLSSDEVRTRFRRILGSLVWLLQTRHQIAFAVTKFATDSPYR